MSIIKKKWKNKGGGNKGWQRFGKRGITLIALVITIIILLILAGITLNLTLGQNGIITRAQQAGKNYMDAAEKEQDELARFLNETDNVINGSSIGNGATSEEDKEKIAQLEERIAELEQQLEEVSKESTTVKKVSLGKGATSSTAQFSATSIPNYTTLTKNNFFVVIKNVKITEKGYISEKLDSWANKISYNNESGIVSIPAFKTSTIYSGTDYSYTVEYEVFCLYT